MTARAIWQFVPSEKDGDEIVFFDAPRGGAEIARIGFPRQGGGAGRCLSDYVLDPGPDGRDHVGLFVTTAGGGIMEASAVARDAGEYVRSHALQALAVETAEGAAEWVHRQIRAQWGFADPETLEFRDLMRAVYHGKRFSFGYPACPDLEGQRPLFGMLDASRIGVQLTEGLMMEPEASVSALVFHHPQARYFSA